MLKKVIVASSLALGFFVSFQVGSSKGTVGASEGSRSMTLQVIQEVKACGQDPRCSPLNPDCC